MGWRGCARAISRGPDGRRDGQMDGGMDSNQYIPNDFIVQGYNNWKDGLLMTKWNQKISPQYCTPSICLSVCPASCVRSVAPTVLVGSFSYVYILSSNFRRCVAWKVYCKILKFEFWAIFKICNFDFVLF